MPESIVKKQSRFSWLLARLIIFAEGAGYDITLGEVWRTPEQAALNAERGIGIKDSVHCDRLAADINLFKNGKWLTKLEDYQPLGEWWEMQGQDCKWGGRFKKRDPCHFSISFRGRA